MRVAIPVLIGILMILATATAISGLEASKVTPDVKTLTLPDGSEMTIDYSRDVVSHMGIETPIIVDELQMLPVKVKETPKEKSSSKGYIHIPYYDDQGNVSLDIYIEDTFYAANQAALDEFWDQFEPRYEILKNMTGWSSKKWFGVPLEIYVYGHTAACYGGNASPTHSNVVFSDPMYKTGCNKPYYENGSTYYNNSGELGDWWPYMNTALHEALHSINPYPIYTRSWLTEGWSEYYMYNVLVESGDINQETADTYLYNGFAGYQWDPYVANDYHDTTVYDRELQRSHGYDITGHMFSKMKYEEGLDWDYFYFLLNNNKDSLDRTFSLGPPYIYYTDTFVLNVFGRAMGHTDWLTQTDVLFNYYSGGGPDGHGYGARNISNSNDSIPMPYGDFDWFGDLSPTLTFSTENPEPEEPFDIIATVDNLGDVNMKNVSIRIYVDDELINERYENINKFTSKQIIMPYSTEAGEYLVEVRVDEDQAKIELDDTNNNDEKNLYVNSAPVLNPIGNRIVYENQLLEIQLFATDPDNDTLTYLTDASFGSLNPDTGLFTWTPTYDDAGWYVATFNVTDGLLYDGETIMITVYNTNSPPYVPSNPAPFNGEFNVDRNAALFWTGGDPDASDTVMYDVYFGTSPEPPLILTNITNTTYDPPGLMEYGTTYYWKIVSNDMQKYTEGPVWNFTTEQAPYICGDADNSNGIDIDDVVYLIAYIFSSDPAPEPQVCVGDADASGGVDIDDVVYLIAYIFSSGPAPSPYCCDG